MLTTLLWVLTPLFLGFALYIQNPPILKFVDKGLMILIYFILFIMGLNLSVMENLLAELTSIAGKTVLYIVMILGCNMAFFYIIDKYIPLRVEQTSNYKPSKLELVLNAGKLLGSIILGLILGVFVQRLGLLSHSMMKATADHTGQIALMILLFFVGIQLRSNGISLKAVFLNRYGIILSVALIISSFLGGMLAALMSGADLIQGLAISSGFGWYSLSASVLQKGFGPTVGSIAFFSDLFREFFAFAVIPIMMRRYPLSAIGSGGATSLDFVLPVIQKSGGIRVVPIAISFGFIINIISPILLAFFASLGSAV